MMNQQEEKLYNFVRDFNKNLRYLIKVALKKNPKDDEIYLVNERVITLMNTNPDMLIKMSGPKLWKYREDIRGNDMDSLLGNDFSEDIEEDQDDEEKNAIISIINKLKHSWTGITEREKIILKNKTREMLRKFIKYGICYIKMHPDTDPMNGIFE